MRSSPEWPIDRAGACRGTEKIQMGDVGILLVSPEQFRNKAFRRAIRQRQVGAWIFDEAHCLSKWGSDFRPDYLYVSRFIREYTDDQPLAQIGCFTATAKPDVLADIQSHFRESLGIEFKVFPGGHERTNLHFEVLPCTKAEKWSRTDGLLREHLTLRKVVQSSSFPVARVLRNCPIS